MLMPATKEGTSVVTVNVDPNRVTFSSAVVDETMPYSTGWHAAVPPPWPTLVVEVTDTGCVAGACVVIVVLVVKVASVVVVLVSEAVSDDDDDDDDEHEDGEHGDHGMPMDLGAALAAAVEHGALDHEHDDDEDEEGEDDEEEEEGEEDENGEDVEEEDEEEDQEEDQEDQEDDGDGEEDDPDEAQMDTMDPFAEPGDDAMFPVGDGDDADLGDDGVLPMIMDQPDFLREVRRRAEMHRGGSRGRSRAADAILRQALGRSRFSRQNAIRRHHPASGAPAMPQYWHPLLDFSGGAPQDRSEGTIAAHIHRTPESWLQSLLGGHEIVMNSHSTRQVANPRWSTEMRCVQGPQAALLLQPLVPRLAEEVREQTRARATAAATAAAAEAATSNGAATGEGEQPHAHGYTEHAPAPPPQHRPSVVAKDGLDAPAEAQKLRSAFAEAGCDEAGVVAVLGSIPRAQRLQIVEAYNTQFSRNFVEDAKAELKGDFEMLVTSAVTPLEDFDAAMLHHCLAVLEKSPVELAEFVATRTAEHLAAVRAAFERIYGGNIIEAIKKHSSGLAEALLIGATTRTTDVPADPAAQVKALTEATGSLGNETGALVAAFSAAGPVRIKALADEYAKVAGITIVEAVEKELTGAAVEVVKTLVECGCDPAGHFAAALHAAMDGPGTRDRRLVRVVLSRSEEDMGAIKDAYAAKYGKALAESIKDDTAGPYERMLLKLIGN
eukprot:m.158304 g.158304  ORF g.158304 m.158304 type:complete len:722 (+) comp15168_c8_seq2:832-2997(+)